LKDGKLFAQELQPERSGVQSKNEPVILHMD